MDSGFDLHAQYQAGLELLRAVLGQDAADAIERARERAAGSADEARVALPVALTWGWLMHREGLSARERVIAMLAIDVARGATSAFRDHVAAARHFGMSSAQISELLLHLGPYAGYPAVSETTHALRGASAGAQTPADDDPSRGWLGAPLAGRAVGIVVSDARKAARACSQLFGIPSWRVTRLRPGLVSYEARQSGSSSAELLRASGTTPAGLVIELCQPLAGPLSHHLQLLTSGPGIHHLDAGDLDPAALQRLLARARAAGITEHTTLRAAGGAALIHLETQPSLGYRLQVAVPDRQAFDDQVGTDEVWGMPDAEPLVPSGPLSHIGVVVRDIAERTAAHARGFGRLKWPVLNFSTDAGTLTEARYAGVPGPDNYLTSIARAGAVAVEIVQPVGGPSRYREGFLQCRGEGVQHLFFGPLPGNVAWESTVAALERAGFPVVTYAESFAGKMRYAYIDIQKVAGFDLELVQADGEIDVKAHACFTFEYAPPS